MKKHWLAIFGEKEIIAAKVAASNPDDMKIHFLSRYKAPGGKDIAYGDSTNSDLDAVKNWFRYQSIPLKELKIAVSFNGLIMTIITLPQMADSDLEKMMAGDMERYFEPNSNNYIIDYRILEKYEENGTPLMKIVMAAYPKERMTVIQTFCSKLGVEANTIDLSADCLTRIYAQLLRRVNDPVSNNPERTDSVSTEPAGMDSASGEKSESKPSPRDIAVVALNSGLVEFVLLKNSNFFLYSDLLVDFESEQNTVNESRGSGSRPFNDDLDIPVESQNKESPLLAFYKEDSMQKSNNALSLEEIEAAEAYYAQIESVKNDKDFVLEDLFVPLDRINQELPMAVTYQNLNEDIPDETDNIHDSSSVISYLSKLLRFYADRNGGKPVSTVYLTGEYCLRAGLLEQFQETLGINVVTAYPGNWKPQFKSGKVSAEEWQRYGAIYGLAIGTEGNQFNFAKLTPLLTPTAETKSKAKVKPKPKPRRYKPFIIAFVAVLAAVILVSPWLWQIKLVYDTKNIEAGIAAYMEVASILETNSKLRLQISDQIHFLDLGNAGSIRNPEVIRSEIDKLLPRDTQVKTFTLKADDTVTLGLVMPDTVSVSKLKALFEKSDSFQSFDIQTISLDESKQEIHVTLQLKH